MTKTLSPTKLADVTRQIGLLSTLPVAQLRRRLEQILAKPVHTRNRAYLIRKLAWHLRDQAEGHQVPRSLQELLDAGPAVLPDRWRERMARALAPPPAPGAAPAPSTAVNPKRDPRLPPAGTELVKLHKGCEHRVLVHEADFAYAGRRYGSLSAIARQIAGSPWNGIVFFGLAKRGGAGTQ